MNNKTLTFFSLLAVIVATFLFTKSCYSGGGKVSAGDTLSVKADTGFVPHNDTIRETVETLVPYKVTYTKEVVLHDTLENIQTILQKVDTSRILNQYFAKRFYTKTSPVKYGSVTITDTVTQNRVTGRRVLLNQKIPEITKTITVAAPKRIVGYFGIEAIGNQNNLPYASGISLGLKLKNDAFIDIRGYLTKDEPMFGIGLKFPLRFRKK